MHDAGGVGDDEDGAISGDDDGGWPYRLLVDPVARFRPSTSSMTSQSVSSPAMQS